MNLPEKSNLTDAKYAEILTLIQKLGVRLTDIDESFIRGGGRGGQKINKSNNAVQLKHLPTGTLVKCQAFRERSMNRILALRQLLWKLDPDSRIDRQSDRIRKQKSRRERRSRQKNVKMP